ncbi:MULTISPECIES: zinc ribbon domain-containing protein [Acidithiobacillus]|nr:transposase [Acidithiobacillus ferridurans]
MHSITLTRSGSDYRPSQAAFHCLHCGHEAHADVNAAL